MQPDLPSVELLTICDFAQVSQENKLSIIGIFDRIYASAFPTIYSRFFVVALIEASTYQEIGVEITVTSPLSKMVIPPFHMKTKIAASGRANILVDLAGITFEEAGEYLVTLRINGNISKKIPLYITLLNPDRRSKNVVIS